MNDERRLLKWAVIIVPVVAAALAVYPPSSRLKAGIDLAGGSSLLFEIDTAGLSSSEKTGLAEKVMGVLKRRVDPDGQLNLIWRPIGNNRLEIQMPRPPRHSLERRHAYDDAVKVLTGLNISKMSVQAMLTAPDSDRGAKRDALVRGVKERDERFKVLVPAYDAFHESQVGDDYDVETAARATYEDALANVLKTSMDLNRLKDVLALPSMTDRDIELAKLRSTHSAAQYGAALDEVVAKYDVWAEDKGMLEDPSDLKRRIRGAGVLEFRILAERDPTSPNSITHNEAYLQEPTSKYTEQLESRGPRARPSDLYRWVEVSDIAAFTNADSPEDIEKAKDSSRIIFEKYAGKWYVLAHAERKFGLLRDSARKWKLTGAFAGIDGNSGGPAVNFELDARGGQQFGDLTSSNLQRPMAIVLDDVAQSYAVIQGMIRQSGQITSPKYTQDKVGEAIATLRAGSLPARLIETPIMEQTIGPQLGEHNREMGVNAAIYGGIAVAIFMLIYYRFAGIVTNLALFMNLLFVLGIMASMQATFTLPGIAGLILTVGMAVDANVLIYERIREERERGVGMRKALRVGYARAFSTIVDANVTTLITCVVLGYVGTEEVKGFAMVLGFGIVTSMFTALFVTRVIFTTLLDKGWMKTLSMTHMFHRPKIDWLSLRGMFWPISSVVVLVAVAFTVILSSTNREALFDIEFLGGTSVQFEMAKNETITDEDARTIVSSREAGAGSAVEWLRDTAAPAIASATVSQVGLESTYTIASDKLSGEQIEALVMRILGKKVVKGGFARKGHTLDIAVDDDAGMTVDGMKAVLAEAGEAASLAAERLAGARIQTVHALDAVEDSPPAFEVITVETNKELVRVAILAVMSERLNIESAISFEVATDDKRAPNGAWPIEDDARYVADVLEEPGANFDILNFKGGALFVFDKLTPPLSVASFEKRIREIRMQPEFSKHESRPFSAIGLTPAGSRDGEDVFSRVAYVVVDENLPYYEDPGKWEEDVAAPELAQAREALASEKSLRKVIQFAPQVASQTQNQAIIAIVMALASIVAYIWIRFGQMQFGLAAIVALAHDVCITLGLVAGAHFVYNTFLGSIFGLSDFKIDLPMIAAFLTIIGYSLNDTIVVFDRIRENRGKLKVLTPAIINNSINQCLSRTVLTSFTTFLAVAIMYVFGGEGIHGFSFALLCGVVVGTYSSVGIACPLLYRPKTLHTVVYVMIALALLGGGRVIISDSSTFLAGSAIVIGAALAWAIYLEGRSTRRMVAGAAGVA